MCYGNNDNNNNDLIYEVPVGRGTSVALEDCSNRAH